MNKYQSNPHFKSKSRQKEKGKVDPARSKGESGQNKSVQLEKGIANSSKSRQKQSKSGKKGGIEQGRPGTTTTKHRQQNKQQYDQYGLCMKADLKHIISRNNAAKSKNHEVVPELLKNIEKNCRALKHIHQKQGPFQGKRSSEQPNKAQKSKKLSIEYTRNEQKSKLRQSLQREVRDKQPLPPKNNRFSLYINEDGLEKSKIEQKLRQNVSRKSVENKEEQKNWVQVYKMYKKSFEIEEFKIEKSNRRTNYNTNQSRNSSSHQNSHRLSRAVDLNFRGKSKEQDKINIAKIEMLIKNQQKKAEVQGDSIVNIEGINANQKQEVQFISSNSKNKDRQFLNKSAKQQKFMANSMVQAETVCLGKHYESNLAKNLENELLLKQPQECEVESPSPSKELLSSKQNIVNQESLEKNFQKSKFYVQPIPKFKNKQNQQKQEPSLQGCEITLIENNVILEDSELVSLQL